LDHFSFVPLDGTYKRITACFIQGGSMVKEHVYHFLIPGSRSPEQAIIKIGLIDLATFDHSSDGDHIVLSDCA